MPPPDFTPRPSSTSRNSRVVFKLAREAEKHGQWNESVVLLKEALALGEREGRGKRTTQIQDDLAVCLLNVGLAARQGNSSQEAAKYLCEAEEHSRKILAARENTRTEGKEVERARNVLAQCLSAQYDAEASPESHEKLMEAIRLLQKNQILQLEKFGNDDDALLRTQHDLALYLARAGNYAEAEKLDTITMRERETKYGPFHKDYLESCYNLANDRLHLGRYSLARNMFRALAATLRTSADSGSIDIEMCEELARRCTAEQWRQWASQILQQHRLKQARLVGIRSQEVEDRWKCSIRIVILCLRRKKIEQFLGACSQQKQARQKWKTAIAVCIHRQRANLILAIFRTRKKTAVQRWKFAITVCIHWQRIDLMLAIFRGKRKRAQNRWRFALDKVVCVIRKRNVDRGLRIFRMNRERARHRWTLALQESASVVQAHKVENSLSFFRSIRDRAQQRWGRAYRWSLFTVLVKRRQAKLWRRAFLALIFIIRSRRLAASRRTTLIAVAARNLPDGTSQSSGSFLSRLRGGSWTFVAEPNLVAKAVQQSGVVPGAWPDSDVLSHRVAFDKGGDLVSTSESAHGEEGLAAEDLSDLGSACSREEETRTRPEASQEDGDDDESAVGEKIDEEVEPDESPGAGELTEVACLFDAENAPSTTTDQQLKPTKDWLGKFKDLRKKTLGSRYIHNPDVPRIKIALLDTGIDDSHPDVHGKYEEYRDFLHPDQLEGIDIDGHGTHKAGIILDLCPFAALYVGRLVDCGQSIRKEKDEELASRVAQAIDYAANIWQVDIISMSFGLARYSEAVHRSIKRAESNNIVFFAAAANSGNTTPVAFPAREKEVLGIFASDGFGKPLAFNPPPQVRQNYLMILGANVEAAWPGGGRRSQSGTSVATPIAACVAAFLYEYNANQLGMTGLQCYRGVERVLSEMAQSRPDGYCDVVPWQGYFKPRSFKSHLINVLHDLHS
ncbi:hypothetical protein EG328_001518 [Venturia inaequalis]|uniref:Peptidase S8/S53 domain-containing protein n=1 Tax=Venturia inaequalis TaxID=5025 RepID=A0A8H3U2C0_VENIN|nr:hypothetical protein EG328_001518 [Venturia inaequalis]